MHEQAEAPDPHGPKNLGKLFGFMRNAVRQRDGVANHKKRVPQQQCQVCSKMFDFTMLENVPVLQPSFCQECAHNLKEGMTAILETNGHRFAWWENPPEKMQGKIIKCATADEFDKITSV